MFMNQVSIKDLFSVNTSVSSGRHDGSGDWEERDNSSSLSNSQHHYSNLSNSQLPYSQQIDFPDSQEFPPASQNSTQRESNSPSKFYQRYMAKGLHTRELSQKPGGHSSKQSYQQQLDVNKARARDRDERDLLNRVLNLLREYGTEVKDAVTEMKQSLEKGNTSTDTRLTEHLSKITERLSENAAEYRRALDIKEKSTEDAAALKQSLEEKNSQIAELKDKIKQLEEENKRQFVKQIEELFLKNMEGLKTCLGDLYYEQQGEVRKLASIHKDQGKEFLNKYKTMVQSQVTALKDLDERLDSGLTETVGRVVDETRRIFSHQGREIIQVQQEQITQLKTVLHREMGSCILDEMCKLKNEITETVRESQRLAGQQKQTSGESHEDDLQVRYQHELEGLRRRFTDEASSLYPPADLTNTRSHTSRYVAEPLSHGRASGQVIPSDRTDNLPALTQTYIPPSTNTSLLFSPRINVVNPAELIRDRREVSAGRVSGRAVSGRAGPGDPDLRNMFNGGSEQNYRSPLNPLTSSWSSNLFSKTNPSPVATVRPQIQGQEVAPPPSKKTKAKKKAKPKRKQAKKSAAPQYSRDEEEEVEVGRRQTRAQKNNSGVGQCGDRGQGVGQVAGQSRGQGGGQVRGQGQGQSRGQEPTMTQLTRISEIYRFESTPARGVREMTQSIETSDKEKNDGYEFTSDSPLTYTSRISRVGRAGDVFGGQEVRDERWEAAMAVGPPRPQVHHSSEMVRYRSDSEEDDDVEVASQTSSPCLSVFELVKRRKLKPAVISMREETLQSTMVPNVWSTGYNPEELVNTAMSKVSMKNGSGKASAPKRPKRRKRRY